QELIFTPQYNYFRPAAPPSPARLTLPAGASAVASAVGAAGTSSLFVAADGGLFVFTPDNQHDRSAPVQVIPGGIVAGAGTIAASTDGGRTAVWGIGPQGQLGYATCAAGREGDPAAWSHPVPLVPAAEQFAFFLNLDAGTSVLFAHIDGSQLVRLTQDPVTAGWSQRNILLPPTAPDDMVEQDTFTTHIQVTDDNRVPLPGASVSVTATSPVSVYLNDVYHLLSPSVAAQVSTDTSGVLTVVQETSSLAGVCFRLTLMGTPAVVADVNPMSKAQATLAAVTSGDDLAGVQVTGSDGTSRPLVPATVAASDRDAAAASLAQLATIGGGLPSDGSRQQAASPASIRASAAGDPGIAVAAGDLFRWLEQAATDVESFVVHEAEGLYHFVATIAGEAYHALLDCYDAVVHAVEFVLSKIEVFFEDLVQWLGFVFGWSDIVRTHQVLKNYIRQFVASSAGSMADIRAGLQNSFTQAQGFIGSWASLSAGIPPGLAAGTADGTTQSAAALPGQDSPQSNWGTQLLRGNVPSGSMPAGGGDPGADVLAAIGALGAAIGRERDVLQAAGASLQADVIGKFHDLSFAQLIEGVIAIFTEALLQSLENVLLAVLDVLEALVEGVVDLLDTAIDIPVLSGLYKEISGDDLSLLDVICLVVAIPATICGKLFSGAAPFPDDATTAALIGAPDFATIQRIRNPPEASAQAFSFAAVAPRSAPDPGDPTDPDSALTENLVLSSAILALFGEYAVNIIGSVRREFPESARLLALGAVFYLPYNAPSFFGDIPNLASGDDTTWPDWMNLTMTSLMAIKAVADIGIVTSPAAETWAEAEPWADGAICLLWMVPTIASAYYAANPKPPDPPEPPESDTSKSFDVAIAVLNGIAGLAFCLNGTLAPAQAVAKDPVTVVAVDSTAAALNHTWGLLSVAAAVTGYAAPA
ncbi:MAG TPA: hypothetical protein VGI96_31590, partial [Streptosporangiaceae bacterium]